MKAVVATFNQEKALEGAFSVITNLRMELFEALVPGTGRGRGVISSSSCAPNVTAQLGLAARLFCCLATPELGQPDTQVSWVKVEDLSIISHHDTLFSTDKRISVCSQ